MADILCRQYGLLRVNKDCDDRYYNAKDCNDKEESIWGMRY